MGVYGIAVLGFFSCGISVILILTCGIAVSSSSVVIGVRAGGARGAAAPPNFGQLRFFGQREKFWVKPVF